MNIIRNLLSCFALIALPVALKAQESVPEITFSVYTWQSQRFLEMGQEIVTVPELYYHSDGALHSFRPRTSRRTGRMRYSGQTPLRFYTLVNATAAPAGGITSPVQINGATVSVQAMGGNASQQVNGNDAPAPVLTPYAEVSIPAGASDVLVFLFADESGGTTTEGSPLKRARAINLGSEQFRPGKPVFFNLSPQSVAVRYNKATEVIPAGGALSVDAPNDGNRSPVMLAVQEGGDWKAVLTTSVSLGNDRRSIVFFEPSQAGSHWQLVRILLD